MAPGAKFSTMTSARFAMFLTRSSPRSDLRLTVMDFLLALNNMKYQESWFWLWWGPDCRPNKGRPAPPPWGFSPLTPSPPSQASASVQDGAGLELGQVQNPDPGKKSRKPAVCSHFPVLPSVASVVPDADVVDINRCLRHSVKASELHAQMTSTRNISPS